MKAVLGIIVAFALMPITSFAQESSMDSVLAVEETTIPMSIPSQNKLPWGFVEGKIPSPADGHPVIIQIYKGQDPVRFAQVPVNDDGTYQYRFRVLDVTDGKTTRIFYGDYTVKIFKVVNLDSNYLDFLAQRSGTSDIGIDVLRQRL